MSQLEHFSKPSFILTRSTIHKKQFLTLISPQHLCSHSSSPTFTYTLSSLQTTCTSSCTTVSNHLQLGRTIVCAPSARSKVHFSSTVCSLLDTPFPRDNFSAPRYFLTTTLQLEPGALQASVSTAIHATYLQGLNGINFYQRFSGSSFG